MMAESLKAEWQARLMRLQTTQHRLKAKTEGVKDKLRAVRQSTLRLRQRLKERQRRREELVKYTRFVKDALKDVLPLSMQPSSD